jgi:hypothetical protein
VELTHTWVDELERLVPLTPTGVAELERLYPCPDVESPCRSICATSSETDNTGPVPRAPGPVPSVSGTPAPGPTPCDPRFPSLLASRECNTNNQQQLEAGHGSSDQGCIGAAMATGMGSAWINRMVNGDGKEDPGARAREENSGSLPQSTGPVPSSPCNPPRFLGPIDPPNDVCIRCQLPRVHHLRGECPGSLDTYFTSCVDAAMALVEHAFSVMDHQEPQVQGPDPRFISSVTWHLPEMEKHTRVLRALLDSHLMASRPGPLLRRPAFYDQSQLDRLGPLSQVAEQQGPSPELQLANGSTITLVQDDDRLQSAWFVPPPDLASSSVVEQRPVKPSVEGSNPPSPAISMVELFADAPVECEPYDNGFHPNLFGTPGL